MTPLPCEVQLKDEIELQSKSTDGLFEAIYLPVKEEIQDDEYKENLDQEKTVKFLE